MSGVLVGAVLAACGHPAGPVEPTTSPTPLAATATSTPSRSPSPEATTTASPSGVPGAVAPVWLGKRPLPRRPDGLGEIKPTPPELQNRRFTLPDQLPQLPGTGFASRVDPVPADVLARSSWTPECPVTSVDLRWVRLTFWGFDDRRHTGELLVNADAAGAIVKAFGRLYAARFPLEEMRITRADELDAKPTGDGNNTSAFTCRPIRGTTTWSEHAKGRAVDVNPFQNPYLKGDVLIPELASFYADRSRQAVGMIRPAGTVVQAFAAAGWSWGGSWQHAKDYMHFSANGR